MNKLMVVKIASVIMSLAGAIGMFTSYMSWSNSGSKDIFIWLKDAYIFPILLVFGILWFLKASKGKTPFEK